MTATLHAKILVVDDTPANLLVMRRLLSKLDVQLVEAKSGAEALAACLDDEFALVLLDVNMPEMDGYEVASLLQEEVTTRQTPIIFVTAAYGDDLNRLRGYNSGAVDYITKPINDHILLSKVRVFLELYRGKRALQTSLEELFALNIQLKEAQQQVHHLAHHDALTGLANRLLFLDRLDTAMQRTLRGGKHFALLYVDIDGFKPVNDTHGHAAGDDLLKQIASRLKHGVRGSDTVARLGGDEFAIIMEEAGDLNEAQLVGTQLCQSMGLPFTLTLAGKPVHVRVGASIGLAMFPDHAQARDALLTAADVAMYRAKRSGKNQCRVAEGLSAE
ncbi:MAG: diguanylate cyclase [Pseudomonadota bacterium]